MSDNYFSDRLIEKVQFYIKNNSLENILLEWLLDGEDKEKMDTYQVLKNLDCFICYIKINKWNINDPKKIKKILGDLILEVLKSPKFIENYELSMSDIELRSWLITCLCLCNIDCSDVEKTISYITKLFNFSELNNYTKFYSIDGITNCIDPNINCYFIECNKFILKFKICENIQSIDNNRLFKHQFLLMLWYIKYKDNSIIEEDLGIIELYKGKIIDILNNSNDINQVSDLLFSYGCIPIKDFVDTIFNLLDIIIKKERVEKFSRYNMVYYLNLVRSFIAIKYIDDDTLSKRKEEICAMLFILLKILRNYTDYIWNPVKCQILRCFRKYYHQLGNIVVIDNLHNELLSEDINVVTAACKTLQTFYNINNSTNIIIDALNKQSTKIGKDYNNKDNTTIIALSNSLKWMSHRDSSVLESLEDKMYRGESEKIRDSARRLISEMGGANAIKKLEVRKNLKDTYSKRINDSQIKIENMFNSTITDAKRGFNISIMMEIIVFFSGIILLLVSGFFAIFSSNDTFNSWIGTAASGTAGCLSILYTLFISKPRKKIKENISHLMYLKVIFLGYLRELNQIDQSFNQHILEEEIITEHKMHFFYTSIDQVMTNCLHLIWANKEDDYEIIKNFIKIGQEKLNNVLNGEKSDNKIDNQNELGFKNSKFESEKRICNLFDKDLDIVIKSKNNNFESIKGLSSIKLTNIISNYLSNNKLNIKLNEEKLNNNFVIEIDKVSEAIGNEETNDISLNKQDIRTLNEKKDNVKKI